MSKIMILFILPLLMVFFIVLLGVTLCDERNETIARNEYLSLGTTEEQINLKIMLSYCKDMDIPIKFNDEDIEDELLIRHCMYLIIHDLNVEEFPIYGHCGPGLSDIRE